MPSVPCRIILWEILFPEIKQLSGTTRYKPHKGVLKGDDIFSPGSEEAFNKISYCLRKILDLFPIES